MHIVLTLNTKEMTNSLCFACDCSGKYEKGMCYDAGNCDKLWSVKKKKRKMKETFWGGRDNFGYGSFHILVKKEKVDEGRTGFDY